MQPFRLGAGPLRSDPLEVRIESILGRPTLWAGLNLEHHNGPGVNPVVVHRQAIDKLYTINGELHLVGPQCDVEAPPSLPTHSWDQGSDRPLLAAR